jgi:PEGA domain-containing protein
MCFRILRMSTAVLAVLAWAASASPQTTATRHVMKDKLVHTQRMLEALMTSDLRLLETESESLAHVTEQPGWMVLTTPEYIRYSSAFLNATSDVVAAAKDHDLDAAAVHFTAMTMACYQCHRYLKNARIAEVATIAFDDSQKAQARRPPEEPAAPPKAVPRHPAPAPRAVPRAEPRVQIYPYPLLLQPEFVYRFPYGLYPYYRWGYPYPPYVYPVPPGWMIESAEAYGSVQFEVAPKEALVFVDGFYAGTVDDFDDAERLDLTPGPHRIELQGDGLRTATLDVNVRADQTIKYRATLQPSAEESR